MFFKSILKVVILLSLLSMPLFSEEKNTPELRSNTYYAAWSGLLPGFGQWKKDRMYSGIFFFSLFAASAINWQMRMEAFHQTENSYRRQIVLVNSYSTASMQSGSSSSAASLGTSIILGQQAFRPYQIASDYSNQALSYMAIIYVVQILHAFSVALVMYFKLKMNPNNPI